MESKFVVEYFGNKEVFVSYTNTIGNSIKLYGTYRSDETPEYRDFVVNRLKSQIEASKVFDRA